MKTPKPCRTCGKPVLWKYGPSGTHVPVHPNGAPHNCVREATIALSSFISTLAREAK